eukprot:PhM_4_TR3445/c0_g1_i1/m.21914
MSLRPAPPTTERSHLFDAPTQLNNDMRSAHADMNFIRKAPIFWRAAQRAALPPPWHYNPDTGAVKARPKSAAIGTASRLGEGLGRHVPAAGGGAPSTTQHVPYPTPARSSRPLTAGNGAAAASSSEQQQQRIDLRGLRSVSLRRGGHWVDGLHQGTSFGGAYISSSGKPNPGVGQYNSAAAYERSSHAARPRGGRFSKGKRFPV